MDVTPESAVVERVKTLAAATSRPFLSDSEVTSSILAHPLPDRDGLTVADASWTPTWHTPAIVSELWGIKAGKVAGDFNFSADGANFSKGDVLANCLKMEAEWGAKVAGSVSTSSYAGTYRGRGVVVNG